MYNVLYNDKATYKNVSFIYHFFVFSEVFKKNLSLFFRSAGNRAYPLKLGSSLEFNVYCHMTNDLEACSSGSGSGWTLVMKIDGDKVLKKSLCPCVQLLCISLNS